MTGVSVLLIKKCVLLITIWIKDRKVSISFQLQCQKVQFFMTFYIFKVYHPKVQSLICCDMFQICSHQIVSKLRLVFHFQISTIHYWSTVRFWNLTMATLVCRDTQLMKKKNLTVDYFNPKFCRRHLHVHPIKTAMYHKYFSAVTMTNPQSFANLKTTAATNIFVDGPIDHKKVYDGTMNCFTGHNNFKERKLEHYRMCAKSYQNVLLQILTYSTHLAMQKTWGQNWRHFENFAHWKIPFPPKIFIPIPLLVLLKSPLPLSQVYNLP